MTGREGKLSWEARAEEVSFEVLPKDATAGLFLTWKGKELKRYLSRNCFMVLQKLYILNCKTAKFKKKP